MNHRVLHLQHSDVHGQCGIAQGVRLDGRPVEVGCAQIRHQGAEHAVARAIAADIVAGFLQHHVESDVWVVRGQFPDAAGCFG